MAADFSSSPWLKIEINRGQRFLRVELFRFLSSEEKPPILSAKQRSISDAAAHFIFTPAAFTLQLSHHRSNSAVTSLVRHDHRRSPPSCITCRHCAPSRKRSGNGSIACRNASASSSYLGTATVCIGRLSAREQFPQIFPLAPTNIRLDLIQSGASAS
jgi:hypothetical protein